MIRTIYLHGTLKKEFGPSFRFDVATAGEALRALNCAFPRKFVAAIKDGHFKLVRGDKRSGMQLDLGLVCDLKLGSADLHLIPVAKGAASASAKGTTKVVLGAALIGGAIFMSGGTLAAPLIGMSTPIIPGLSVTYGSIAGVGLAISLSGAAQLLSHPATSTTTNQNSADINTGSIGNSGKQGDAVQLIYGEVLTGSVPISVASDVEDINVYADNRGSIEATFGHAFTGSSE